MTNNQRLKKLADRMAVMLVHRWAIEGTLAPFDDELFWLSDDCNEIRAMPEYQEAVETIRIML